MPLDQSWYTPVHPSGYTIRAENGEILFEQVGDRNGIRIPVTLHDIPDMCIAALIASEDKRFYKHHGIDYQAIIRAALHNITAGAVKEGASTITMQTVRIIYTLPHTYAGKIKQAWLALRVSRHVQKKTILIKYLNRVHFGRQTYGIGAAARVYFSKDTAHLSESECIALIALIRAPAKNDPIRHPIQFHRAYCRVINALSAQGYLTPTQANDLAAYSPQIRMTATEKKAPHYADFLSHTKSNSVLETTIDIALQEKAEYLLQQRTYSLHTRQVYTGAVVILDAQTGAVKALVGSSDYHSPLSGQFNAAMAKRQCGSILKPLIYAMAFDRGASPGDVIIDEERSFGNEFENYLPKNYDHIWHGRVTLRQALQHSYNIPAIELLEQIGINTYLTTLHTAGFTYLDKTPRFYGYGLALGVGEVRPIDIAAAYSAFVNNGHVVRPRYLKTDPIVVTPPLFSEESAWLIWHILSDRNRADITAAHLRVPLGYGYKTGTTKDFRDSVAVVFDAQYIIAAWIGNPEGNSMAGVSGSLGALTLAGNLARELPPHAGTIPAPPTIITQKITPILGHKGAEQPVPLREVFDIIHSPQWKSNNAMPKLLALQPSALNTVSQSPHSNTPYVHITTPLPNATYVINPTINLDKQKVAISIDSSDHFKSYVYIINDTVIETTDTTVFWKITPGNVACLVYGVLPNNERVYSTTISFRVL